MALLGDGGQWWTEGEQREREKSLRESKGRGRNLRERDVGDRLERVGEIGRQSGERKRIKQYFWFYNSATVRFYL